MSQRQLCLDNVVAGYGGTTVLDGVNLTVSAGERVGILGRNGAGKSTTLKACMGLARMHGGHVFLGDNDVTTEPTWKRVRMGVGYVPQTRDIFPSLTVEENLHAALYKGSQASIRDAYELFPRLNERRANFGNELSGGEQQMLSIARALMGNPKFLLLDEPLEGLSPIVAHEVMAAIRKLCTERGLGCVLVEQHVGLVLGFSSKILVLERGRPAFWGLVSEIEKNPEILESSVALGKTTLGPLS